MSYSFDEILTFWFETLSPKQHFTKDKTIDVMIAAKFAGMMPMAAAGAFRDWQQQASGSLALVLLLDQFPRNAFRDLPDAFAHDDSALKIAQFMVREGQDMHIEPGKRAFCYMPYMHAEDVSAQNACVQLFTERLPGSDNIRFAEMHRDIIVKFGRFPHRNEILGRVSTEAENKFLADGGFKG